MDRLLERLGYAGQWVADTLRDAAANAVEHATPDEPLPHPGSADEGLLPEGIQAQLLAAALSAGGAWAASRLLRPEPVSWGRAVAAGIVGTFLYDAVEALEARLLERELDTITPLGEPLSDDPEIQRWVARGGHYAAGIGLAVFYARYVHHRIPGPPVLRGALFGGLDGSTLHWGGLIPLLNRLHPDLDLPTGISGLTEDPELGARVLARHLAYGVGLGAVYGARARGIEN